MKKVLLSAVIALTSMAATNVYAQEGLSVSVKAVPQLSWMMNSDEKDDATLETSPVFGVGFGVGANYNFNKHMGIGLDVLFSMQGQKYEYAGVESAAKVNYLKIPLMFTYTTGIDSNHKVAFIGKVGPQFGLLLSSKAVDGDGNTILDDTKEFYSDVNIGAVIGAGARFALAKDWTLDAGLRFDYEFTNADNEDFILYTPGQANTNNMTLGLEVGLNYHF